MRVAQDQTENVLWTTALNLLQHSHIPDQEKRLDMNRQITPHGTPRWNDITALSPQAAFTDLCVSVGDAWVQYGWGKSGCIRCKCSCELRHGLPCAAAMLSGSGSASHKAGKRWPCPSLRSKKHRKLIRGKHYLLKVIRPHVSWLVACLFVYPFFCN